VRREAPDAAARAGWGAAVSGDYGSFLATKTRQVQRAGIDVATTDVHPTLHPWQAEIVVWATKVGRAALWADTGLGKTFMQLEWARLSGETSLIVAPLAVCAQTVREAAKIGIEARYVRSDDEIDGPGIWVTNYEMVTHFAPVGIDAVVLDESSILKSSTGATRTLLIEHFRSVERRLSCTATPAPNDPEELTNQAEFLGVMSRVEMLAAYFVHDSDEGWRLKGHARGPMFQWMATWALAIRRPSDLGYPDDGYVLPGLDIREHLLDVDVVPEGALFATELGGVGGRASVRRATMQPRCEKAAELVRAEPDEPWLIWCGLNDESDLLAQLIPGSVNVHGSMPPEEKARLLLGFADGDYKYLITKMSIASFGLNFQHCARMIFVGMNDSYEGYYQGARRCYRYGQKRVVEAHIVLSSLEGQIAANVRRKEHEAKHNTKQLVAAMRTARTAA
jgi:superfamily II DNA or RNA helicase